MNTKGVAIGYGDFAPEAKENFVPTASESEFNTLEQLQKYNLNFPNYANPCEQYNCLLDGSAKVPPENQTGNIGLWSTSLSDENGDFKTPIVLTLTSTSNHTSVGLTFTFDVYNDTYPTNMNIKWYRGEQLLKEGDFNPNSAFFFCEGRVEFYNKVVITFSSLNMPFNRLKLRAIDYGIGTEFKGGELRNVKLIQEIDPISTQISINTCDFTLDSSSNIEYSFQAKQPLTVTFNGRLIATSFVKSAKRKSKNLWEIQSEDYVGLLDSIPFAGGIYVDKSAVDLFAEIFAVAKVPFKIDKNVPNETVSGYIPYTTCRNALMQVAFAVQAIIDTSNSDVIRVYVIDTELKQTIPLKRIMQGQNFTDKDRVSRVEITAHTYRPINETVELYNSRESGVGNNILLKFSQPIHSLTISNGTIVKSGTNFAVINANLECVLSGKKYDHTTSTKSQENPLVLSTDIERVVSVENATLISRSNIDKVLEKCYNYFTKEKSISLKIVEGKHIIYGGYIKYGQGLKYGSGHKYGEKLPNIVDYDQTVNVGQTIIAKTEYLSDMLGTVIKQSFNLNGRIIIKDTIMR